MNQEDSSVCHRCFKDNSLVDFIRERGKKSWCDWCGARNVYVVPLFTLGDSFREAVTIYESGNWGDEPISLLLQENWNVFSDKIEEAPDNLMQELTVAILKAGLTAKEYYTDYPDFDGGFRREDSWLVDHWHEKAEAYFDRGGTFASSADFSPDPKSPVYADFPDQLELALEDLSTTYELGKPLFRARIHKDRFRSERFDRSDLGAPPKHVTPAGRANRKGAPVLYCANDAATALAEVRAWKGTAVAIGELKARKRLSIVSLLHYEFPSSPFFDEMLMWKIQLGELFERLSYELSSPVIASEDEKMYFSTQYLCDWVRKAGYDGIEYPSAMGDGFNIVVFNPEDVEPIDVRYVRVTNIHHAVDKIGEYHPIYDEGPFDYLFR